MKNPYKSQSICFKPSYFESDFSLQACTFSHLIRQTPPKDISNGRSEHLYLIPTVGSVRWVHTWHHTTPPVNRSLAHQIHQYIFSSRSATQCQHHAIQLERWVLFLCLRRERLVVFPWSFGAMKLVEKVEVNRNQLPRQQRHVLEVIAGLLELFLC